MVFNQTDSILATLIFGIVFGILCGIVNGVLVGVIHMPAFIVTLATMLIYRSIAQYICQHVDKALIGGGSSVSKMSPLHDSYQAFYGFGNGKIATIPVVGIILILIEIVFIYITTTTKLGKKIYAVGSNEKAAMMNGINVDMVKTVVFAITGALVGVASFLWIGCMPLLPSCWVV
jgi:ribose transport system permease protein